MTNTGAETIDLAVEGPIATITIRRESVRNAFDLATAKRFVQAVDAVESSPEIRVAVLTGAGEIAFSAGADLRARARGESRASFAPHGFAGFVRRPRTKPFIAAVNGYAVGGGLEIAMACELVVAAPHATFALPEPLRGLIAGGDCLPIAFSRLPAALAWRLALTGQRITAQEALATGMINGVAEDVRQAARELAQQVLAAAPAAVAATMELGRALLSPRPDGYDDRVETTQRRLFESRDAEEGAKAFLERRAPAWTGT